MQEAMTCEFSIASALTQEGYFDSPPRADTQVSYARLGLFLEAELAVRPESRRGSAKRHAK